jgi:hypothetical protein
VRRAIVLALLAACGGKSEEECRTEATALGDLLVEVAKEPGSMFVIPDDLPLVKRTDLPIRTDLSTGPTVTLTPASIKLGEDSVTDVAALGVRLADAYAKLQADLESGKLRPTWVKEPRRVYFLIDPATPWERVVAAVGEANQAGLTAPGFVFEQPQTVTPPPRAPMDDKLDAVMKAEPSERASEVAKLASKLVDKCAPLKDSFGRVAGVEGENKAMVIARSVKPSLVACKCGVDVPALRAVLFRVMFVPRPPRVITFDPSGGKQPIALPKTTTWAEASKRFTPTLKNAELIAN